LIEFDYYLRLMRKMMEIDREKAFEELVLRHRDMIWHTCTDYSLSAAWEVQDAVQEVLYVLWRDFGKFDGRSSEKTWVYRVVTNTMLSLKRKASNLPHLNQEEIPDTAEEDSDNYQLLLQLIDNLNDEDKKIIRAQLDGFKIHEIASMTGLSVATIGRRLQSIRKYIHEEYLRQK